VSDERLKIKVGALIVVSVTLLVGFVVLLGSFSVGEKRVLYLEFTDSGSVLSGAPVKIAGVRAGRVESVEFLVERDARKSKARRPGEPRINVRLTITVDVKMAAAVREDSEFYITTQGVLGEKYVEIVPGSDGSPAWGEDSFVRGHDPPRLDLLFAKADSILGQFEELLGGDSVDIGELLGALTRLTKNLDRFMNDHRERLDRMMVNLDASVADVRVTLAGVRTAVGDGTDMQATIAHARRLAEGLARDAPPLTAQAKKTLANADASLTELSGMLLAHRADIDAALSDLPAITRRAKDVARDTAAITAGLTKGQGTVGQLLTDRELYDDLKEMLRDLKRHPWKMLWKE
jgi:phospholipid/cholesterol/gamma-HCH transport system substrate-binding protein